MNDFYTIRVHHEPDGTHWAEVIELPGCFASGDNFDELKEALEEAIGLYLSTDDNPLTIKIAQLEPLDAGTEVSEERVLVST